MCLLESKPFALKCEPQNRSLRSSVAQRAEKLLQTGVTEQDLANLAKRLLWSSFAACLVLLLTWVIDLMADLC